MGFGLIHEANLDCALGDRIITRQDHIWGQNDRSRAAREMASPHLTPAISEALMVVPGRGNLGPVGDSPIQSEAAGIADACGGHLPTRASHST